MAKLWLINSLIFLALIIISLAFLWAKPIQTTNTFFGPEDKELFPTAGLIKYPNYYAGLFVVTIVSIGGLAFSASRYEKAKREK